MPENVLAILRLARVLTLATSAVIWHMKDCSCPDGRPLRGVAGEIGGVVGMLQRQEEVLAAGHARAGGWQRGVCPR